MKKVLYSLLVLLTLLVSCKKEANVDLPDAKKVPVLYCYICPGDSFISLRLSLSQPIFKSNSGNIYESVSNANVQISSTQGVGQLIYSTLKEKYELAQASYPIVPGQTYKLKVTLSNGEVAEAEAQVPNTLVPITTVSVETVQEQWGDRHVYKTYFTDPAGVSNYYRIALVTASKYAFQTDTFYNDTGIRELLSDANHDGESLRINANYYQSGDSLTFTDVYLLNCNNSYYKFHTSLQNYQGDNPFAEPVLTYSNIKGGLGCFGAYTKSTFRYKK